jgi:hypothetical protein
MEVELHVDLLFFKKNLNYISKFFINSKKILDEANDVYCKHVKSQLELLYILGQCNIKNISMLFRIHKIKHRVCISVLMSGKVKTPSRRSYGSRPTVIFGENFQTYMFF